MKPAILAFMALSLGGCATLPSARICQSALTGFRTAQELIPILVRDFGLSEAKASSWATIIMASRKEVERFCRLVDPPVAVL
jgi:hypothetical protein